MKHIISDIVVFIVQITCMTYIFTTVYHAYKFDYHYVLTFVSIIVFILSERYFTKQKEV